MGAGGGVVAGHSEDGGHFVVCGMGDGYLSSPQPDSPTHPVTAPRAGIGNLNVTEAQLTLLTK